MIMLISSYHNHPTVPNFNLLYAVFILSSFMVWFQIHMISLFLDSGHYHHREASKDSLGASRQCSLVQPTPYLNETAFMSNFVFSIQAKQNFRESDLIFPGKDGNFEFNTTLLRHILIKKFQTEYGCPSDPVFGSIKEHKPLNLKTKLLTNLQEAVDVNEAPRVALLFLFKKSFQQERIWTWWMKEAQSWSLKMYQNKEGPYKGYTKILEGNETHLFSVYTHLSPPEATTKKRFRVPRALTNKFAFFFGGNTSDDDADAIFQLPEQLRDRAVPFVAGAWGRLNLIEFQLLQYALTDVRNSAFIFVSDTAVPVKPFSFIYNQFQNNPRSRFGFAHVNLPLIRKHSQWIVLNRQHAFTLATHPELWVCHQWFYQPYFKKNIDTWAAPDEYLPFHALSEVHGVTSIFKSINNGEIYSLPIQDFTSPECIFITPQYLHTWKCWKEFNQCTDIGKFWNLRLSSPVTYYEIYSEPFNQHLLENEAIWFARKFSKKCLVEITSNQSTISEKSVIPLDDWLISRLSQWKPSNNMTGE